MISLIDTHAHIYEPEFDDDRQEVITRAEEAGVVKILLPAIDEESYARQDQLASSRPDLFCQMMGLHPTSVDERYSERLKIVHNLLFKQPDRYVGIGEIGLDLYWDQSHYNEQCIVLDKQICWAEELDKPIVLHIRNAYDEIFQLLKHHGSSSYKGIMHCFSGTLDEAKKALDLGFLLGIGGVLTYKKSQLPDIVKALPMDSFVLETDCPYLAPMPHRGKRNESAYVSFIAEKMAEIKETDIAAIAADTCTNAQKLFSM